MKVAVPAFVPINNIGTSAGRPATAKLEERFDYGAVWWNGMGDRNRQ
jgi:hypothetical protein